MSNLPPILQILPPVTASPLRLHSHLQDLLRITAASWGLETPAAGSFLPGTHHVPPRALAPARDPLPRLRA